MLYSFELACALEELAAFFSHDVKNIYMILNALRQSLHGHADGLQVNNGPSVVPVVNTDLMNLLPLFMELVATFKEQLHRSREQVEALFSRSETDDPAVSDVPDVPVVPDVPEAMDIPDVPDNQEQPQGVDDSVEQPAGPDRVLLNADRLREVREHSAILAICYRIRRRLKAEALQKLARMFHTEIMYSNACCLELLKRVMGGTLYDGMQLISGVQYFRIPGSSTMIPCIETLYLWNTLAAQADDAVPATRMLRLIEEARDSFRFNGSSSGMSRNTRDATLDFIRGCCLQRIGQTDAAINCFRNISSLENVPCNRPEDQFLIPFALLQEALYYYDTGVINTAHMIVSYVWDEYDNMSPAARTFCVAFANIMNVILRFPQ
ncbi:Tetratricopeptide repeat protein 39A [Papilio xuthus]|uniref:Tetratricopeptide repeat protein 39A n=1 Tax=Papilio xuthus TaxID=66420 RepID=A0A194PRW0_PAPXU|nr:Tetratricopeptide repeat protein 39A [Papilio xuthus]